MALGLNPQCRNRLTELLTQYLPLVKVDNGMFLDLPSTFPLLLADQALPQNGQINERLEELIGESPLFEFVFSTLARELRESQEYQTDSKGLSLVSIQGYEDPQLLAQRLVTEFESLPRTYTFSLELPDSVSALLNASASTHVLSDSVSITAHNDELTARLPLVSGIEKRDENVFGPKGLLTILNDQKDATWTAGAARFELVRDGFVGYYSTTRTVDEVFNTIKSFIGLGLAVRLFSFGKTPARQTYGVPKRRRLIVHLNEGETRTLFHSIELPVELDDVLSRLTINDLNGDRKGDALVEWVRSRIPYIVTAFRNPERSTHVLRAVRWLVDSHHGENALLCFVQAAVAMEIMLGDESKSDVIGIGELIRNRCAYLIGDSHTGRKEVLDDFSQIYRVRSKIVHSGKDRLTGEEQTLFRKLQWMCRRVAYEELELIGKDKK